MMAGSCVYYLVALMVGTGTDRANSASLVFRDEEDTVIASQLNIVEEPQSVQLVEGTSADLSCEAFGTPVPTIQWMKDGKPIQHDAHNTPKDTMRPPQQKKYSTMYSPVMAEKIRNHGVRTFQMSTTSSKIHVPCANRDTQGTYTCVASNGKETVSATATVSLVDKSNALWYGNDCPRKRAEDTLTGAPAQIYMWTDSRMERPGVSVQLMCRTVGKPAPKTVWYETNDADDESSWRLITPDDQRYTVLPNGDLLVKETPTDVPVSMFKCKAINQYGQDSVTSMLLEVIDDTATGKENGYPGKTKISDQKM